MELKARRCPPARTIFRPTIASAPDSAGNVAAGSITTLIDRPLGVSGVSNPAGGDRRAGRAVGRRHPHQRAALRADSGARGSITDYQNFAASFAGIAKAYAIWIPSGPGRGVFLTVAAAGGSALPPGNPTLDNLVSALQNYGNPLIPIHVQSFLETLFSFSADIRYDPAYDADRQLRRTCSHSCGRATALPSRTFGQGVSADEIAAFIQGVPASSR